MKTTLYANTAEELEIICTYYNEDAHKQLVALGYEYERVEAEFDDGTPEDGPGTWGHPPYDQYTSDVDYIIIDESGHFVHHEMRDLKLEEFLDGPSDPRARP